MNIFCNFCIHYTMYTCMFFMYSQTPKAVDRGINYFCVGADLLESSNIADVMKTLKEDGLVSKFYFNFIFQCFVL